VCCGGLRSAQGAISLTFHLYHWKFSGFLYKCVHCIPALALLPHTYHLMPTVKHLLSKVSNQSTPSEDVAQRLDTLATCIPILASSDMYVAIGHVLIEIFKHVLTVWNTVYLFKSVCQKVHVQYCIFLLHFSSQICFSSFICWSCAALLCCGRIYFALFSDVYLCLIGSSSQGKNGTCYFETHS
jgi:hypothetical protein